MRQNREGQFESDQVIEATVFSISSSGFLCNVAVDVTD